MNLINTPKTMSSIELLDLINESRRELGQPDIRHNKLIEKIVDELEGEHYTKKVVQNLNKTESTICHLTIEQCTLVGMRESKAVRRQVLAKLKQMESGEQFKIPQTLPEALQLAADLAKEIEEAKPKLEVYEALADRKGDVSTTIIAKQLGLTAIKLNKILRDEGVKWQKADLPKAGYQDWFNVVSDVKNGHEFTQCLVTPLGQIEIAKLIKESK